MQYELHQNLTHITCIRLSTIFISLYPKHLEQDIAQQCKDLFYEAYEEEDCSTSGKSGKSGSPSYGKSGKSGPTSPSEGKSGKSGPTSPSEGKSGKSGPTSPSAGKSGKSGSFSPSHGKSGKSGSKCQTPTPKPTDPDLPEMTPVPTVSKKIYIECLMDCLPNNVC